MSAPASSRSEINERRRSWGENDATLAWTARFFSTWSTAWSVRRWIVILPPLLILQKSGPGSPPRATSQSFRASAEPLVAYPDDLYAPSPHGSPVHRSRRCSRQNQGRHFPNVVALLHEERRSERHHEFRPAKSLVHMRPSTRKSRRRRQAALQSQFPRAVFPEQIAVSDIAPKHLNRFVPGLRHDRPLRRSRNGRAGGMPGPERVPSILGSVQTGALYQFLHHASHVDTGQPACLYLPMSIDGAEHRPDWDGCLFDPCLHCADRTRLGIRSVRNPNLAADAFLVHFRSPQRHRQAILAESAILNIQPNQFRSAECSREPKQD